MQIHRLLEIVYVLLEQKLVTAKELAGRFSVSQRTIYRDIDTLSIAGIPVYSEKGKGGGIRLLPEFVLNKSILNEQEQHEILSALQVLSGVKAVNTDHILKKLSAIFNKNTANWLQVDFSDWSSTKEDFFNEFKTAILEQRIAEFDYYSTYGEKTRRRIEPIQLWFKAKAWYVKGHCLARQNLRFFKLTRIKNLKVTEKHFAARDPVSNPLVTSPDELSKREVTLKLRIEPEMTYRVLDEFNEKMVKKQRDGSYIVTITMPDDPWAYGLVLSYGEYIEVLKPDRIRKIIKDKAKKIFKKYL